MSVPARLGAALDEFITGALAELAGIRGELSALRAEGAVRHAFVQTQLDASESARVELCRCFVEASRDADDKVAEALRQAREAEGEAIDRASGRVARLLQEVASHGVLTSGIGTIEGPDGLQPVGKETEGEDDSSNPST